MRYLAALIGICVALSACTTIREKPTVEPAPAPAAQPAQPAPKVDTAAERQQRVMEELSAKSVFFAPGSTAVNAEYRDLIAQAADLMKSAPKVSLTLTGNSDERGHGSKAMGMKRAEAVRQALASAGVAAERVQVESEGKDKPRATCHAEKCWAQNRRVDFAFRVAAGK